MIATYHIDLRQSAKSTIAITSICLLHHNIDLRHSTNHSSFHIDLWQSTKSTIAITFDCIISLDDCNRKHMISSSHWLAPEHKSWTFAIAPRRNIAFIFNVTFDIAMQFCIHYLTSHLTLRLRRSATLHYFAAPRTACQSPPFCLHQPVSLTASA